MLICAIRGWGWAGRKLCSTLRLDSSSFLCCSYAARRGGRDGIPQTRQPFLLSYTIALFPLVVSFPRRSEYNKFAAAIPYQPIAAAIHYSCRSNLNSLARGKYNNLARGKYNSCRSNTLLIFCFSKKKYLPFSGRYFLLY